MTDTTTEAVERLARACQARHEEIENGRINLIRPVGASYGQAAATLRALAQERDALAKRIAWLEEIREGAGRALCEVDGIAPDEPIADGGHVAWQLHVYQRAHAALAAKENEQ